MANKPVAVIEDGMNTAEDAEAVRLERLRVAEEKAAAKKAGDAQIKSAEFNAIQEAAYAAAYEGSFYTDETGERRYAGDKNKLAQPEYKQKEAEMKLAAAQAF